MGISSEKPAPTVVLSAPAESGPEQRLEPRTLEPGTLVSNRYRVVSLLGEGAMGSVYQVEHVHMRKPFALKVLHAKVSRSPEFVARFEREAVAAGNIGHPNIAAATDFGKLPDGSYFLVLELIAGRSLRAELSGGRLEPPRAIKIMRGIVAGVAAAHGKGIVHRDLKPENIMLVDRDGDPDFVKVLDFGMAKIDAFGFAKLESGMQPLTRVGTVMGTPVYMSPEQAVAQPVDARSDLYTLGVILFELLTGDCPFRGGMVTVVRRHLMEHPPQLPPETFEKWDPATAEIVRRLLAKDPEERFQTAADLAAALDAVARQARIASARRVPGRAELFLGEHVLPRVRRYSTPMERFFHERVMPGLQQRLPTSMVRHVTTRRAAIALCLFLASIVAASTLVFCNPSARQTEASSLGPGRSVAPSSTRAPSSPASRKKGPGEMSR